MTEQQKSLKHLSDQELQRTLNEAGALIANANAELERRKPDQFDFFEPEGGDTYYFYNPRLDKAVDFVEFNDSDDRPIQLVLTKRKTKAAAEKDGELWKLTKKIEHRIAKLNREQGWACDWGNGTQAKHFLWFDHEDGFVRKEVYGQRQYAQTEHHMSQETIEKILTEFTGTELRAFVSQEWLPQ